MSASYRLNVITPERQLLDQEVDFITAPGADGCFGVLPGHAPLVTLLNPGELAVGWGEKPNRYAISGGYAEVQPERVTILVERAVAKADIDLKVTQAELEEAEIEQAKLVPNDPAWNLWEKRRSYANACLEVYRKKE
ncbi:MAG: ATP synthase F1 subunit epsilon [Magnetococcales bacterium]|nr:ATP synthase F1 subunit epsilon [Magnetococcales bacterium]